MLAGNNQTLMALYTVPAGKTAYITHFYGSMTITVNKSPTGANIKVWEADRAAGWTFKVKNSLGIQAGGGNIEQQFNPPVPITEKTDIRMDAVCADEDGQVSVGFDLLLVDN
jgi:hypothetical protein